MWNLFNKNKHEKWNSSDYEAQALIVYPHLVKYAAKELESYVSKLQAEFPNIINVFGINPIDETHQIKLVVSKHFRHRITSLLCGSYSMWGSDLVTDFDLLGRFIFDETSPERGRKLIDDSFKRIFDSFTLLGALTNELEERKYRGRGIRSKTVTYQQMLDKRFFI